MPARQELIQNHVVLLPKLVLNAEGESQSVPGYNPALDVWPSMCNVWFPKPAREEESKSKSFLGRSQHKSLIFVVISKQTSAACDNDYEALIKLIFPNTPIKSLKGLARVDLMHRAFLAGHCFPITSYTSSTSPDLANTSSSVSNLEANERLLKLQYHDTAVSRWKEGSPRSCHISEILSQDRNQFVGISSVAVVVRALKTILPINQPDFPASEMFSPNTFSYSPAIFVPSTSILYCDEQRLIDAYFFFLHVFAPVIDESSFRYKYFMNQGCQDRSWLALLNMVLALGSIADSRGKSNEDIQYYNLACQYLSSDSFGSDNLEMLQALVLMGGQYSHFRNRPKMASAIIGACYRTAVGLGLHLSPPEAAQGNIGVQEEVKRRICSTIYVLDTWGSLTLDRPLVPSDLLIQSPQNVTSDQVILQSYLRPY
jgi:hypothetical protein